jgi:hypothetical protein
MHPGRTTGTQTHTQQDRQTDTQEDRHTRRDRRCTAQEQYQRHSHVARPTQMPMPPIASSHTGMGAFAPFSSSQQHKTRELVHSHAARPKKTDRQTDRQTHTPIHTQTDKQPDTQTDRQTNRQTDTREETDSAQHKSSISATHMSPGQRRCPCHRSPAATQGWAPWT